MSSEHQVALSGRVQKIVFRAPGGDYTVLALAVTSRDVLTVQGSMPDVVPGESISVVGHWEMHPKFGRQFKVASYSKQLPADAAGIQKYLSSGLIKGIGESFAQKLVDHFGSQTLEVIDKQPYRLKEVPGVGEKRVEAICAAWIEQKEVANVMVFLKARDVSTSFAGKIFKLYGKRSIDVISENPYRLVEDIWGVGFKTADDLALKLGLDRFSVQRAQAGVLHVLSEAMGDGNTVVLVAELLKTSVEILDFDIQHESVVTAALDVLDQTGKIKRLIKNEVPAVALAQCFRAERRIASKIAWLMRSRPRHVVDSAALYAELVGGATKSVPLNEAQQKGILACFEHKVSVITGGPGTGKTTLVRRLLELLEHHKVTFKLAAPTGRASKRMFEGTGRATETLHRMLEFDPAGMGFKRNHDNVLDLDFLIVDEASMIDVFLLSSVVDALPAHAHLVLLGDIDQLPSVGPGNVLKDLIASGIVSVTRLKEIFRQAQDSMIIVNAHKINQGEYPSSRGNHHDFFVLNRNEPQACIEALRKIYATTLAGLKIDPQDSIVLTPMNRGAVGTASLNIELQALLNPGNNEHTISRFGTTFKKGDRVMQIKNNYTKFIFNGDIGYIESIDKVNQRVVIVFGEKSLEYELFELNEIVLAYAISIHKSQGSEFKAVIIPILMQHFVMLQRNLIYTAVTRAKQLCVIVGDPRALAMAVRNNKEQARLTMLREFLCSVSDEVAAAPTLF